MAKDRNSAERQSRFTAILANPSCANQPYDRVILEDDNWVVAPTLGSIIPFWFLVIPKLWHANFVQWQAENDDLNPYKVVEQVCATLAPGSERFIWFEHGAMEQNSTLSCGVDHAHLHVILDPPFSFEEFETAACEIHQETWYHNIPSQVYTAFNKGAPYLVAGTSAECILSVDVELVGSQFFRRVVARAVGQKDAWGYREYPYLENVQQTLQMFGN